MIALARNTDHLGPLTPDRQSLAADPLMLRLAVGIARNAARHLPYLRDEFESAALGGLCTAAGTFDPRWGVAFKTHAARRIRGAIRDAAREAAPRGFNRKSQRARFGEPPDVVSLSVLLTSSGSNRDRDDRPYTIGDVIPADESSPSWAAETCDAVEDLIAGAGLTAAEKAVVRTLYTRADGATMKRAGRVLGLSESRVSYLHTRAIERMRGEGGGRN